MTGLPHRTSGDRIRRAVLADSVTMEGFLPTTWLRPTGRVEAVLAAWRRGALAEVPAGSAWDIVRIPSVLGPETVRHLRIARVPLGPVLAGPSGAEFVVELGTADVAALPDATVLPRGTLVLMPHPTIVDPYRVGDRNWLVGPSDRPLTRGPDLATAYALARTDAAAALR